MIVIISIYWRRVRVWCWGIVNGIIIIMMNINNSNANPLVIVNQYESVQAKQ